MTVIAWDGKTLAADRLVCFGGTRAHVTKIRRVGDLIIGGAGATELIYAMLDWFDKGADPKEFPTSQRERNNCPSILVVTRDAKILHYESTPDPIVIENKFWAIGSGSTFALAAMHLGRDSREAVEVACALDSNCGNGIDMLTLEP